MTKMTDLIDRKALLAEYDRVHIGEPGKARKLMEDAPTIDAVQVVRCKDCPYSRVSQVKQGKLYCEALGMRVDKDSFCSYGERRE